MASQSLLPSGAGASSYGVRTYEQNLRAVAQQKGSRLRPWVQEVAGKDMHLWDLIGTVAVASKAAGKVTTPEDTFTQTRRRSKPTTYHTSTILEREEIESVLVDPTSALVTAQGSAIGRKIDDIIIAAALGATESEDGTSTAFPGGQGLGSASQAFDFNFIASIQAKFMSAEIFPDEEKVIVVRPNAVQKILAMSQATSSDYVNAKVLATTGYIDKWMGFTWVVNNNLTNVTGNQYYYLAMTRRAVGLHVTEDITSKVAEDPTISFAKRVYSRFSMGATRIEDAQVVRLHVLES